MFCSQDGVCVVEETGGDSPVITSVSGNDPSDATRVVDGLIVNGERLANAALEVRGDKGNFGLSIRSATDQRIEAGFPPNILDGRYTLVAVNGAGEDQTYVQLTLPWLTGEQLVDRINDINDSSKRLAVSVLPVGTSDSQVVAGDHGHAGVYAAVSHDHAGVYAAGDHGHAGVYAAVSHDHAGVYAAVSHDHAGVYAAVSHSHGGSDLSLVPETGVDAGIVPDATGPDAPAVDRTMSRYQIRVQGAEFKCEEAVTATFCALSLVGVTVSADGTHKYCYVETTDDARHWHVCARSDGTNQVDCQMTCF